MAANSELTKEVLQRQRTDQALQRSEAYLAEAQRVSHTGSFGWSVSSGHVFWSDETFRILEYDPANKPTVEVQVAVSLATGKGSGLPVEVVIEPNMSLSAICER